VEGARTALPPHVSAPGASPRGLRGLAITQGLGGAKALPLLPGNGGFFCGYRKTAEFPFEDA